MEMESYGGNNGSTRSASPAAQNVADYLEAGNFNDDMTTFLLEDDDGDDDAAGAPEVSVVPAIVTRGKVLTNRLAAAQYPDLFKFYDECLSVEVKEGICCNSRTNGTHCACVAEWCKYGKLVVTNQEEIDGKKKEAAKQSKINKKSKKKDNENDNYLEAADGRKSKPKYSRTVGYQAGVGGKTGNRPFEEVLPVLLVFYQLYKEMKSRKCFYSKEVKHLTECKSSFFGKMVYVSASNIGRYACREIKTSPAFCMNGLRVTFGAFEKHFEQQEKYRWDEFKELWLGDYSSKHVGNQNRKRKTEEEVTGDNGVAVGVAALNSGKKAKGFYVKDKQAKMVADSPRRNLVKTPRKLDRTRAVFLRGELPSNRENSERGMKGIYNGTIPTLATVNWRNKQRFNDAFMAFACGFGIGKLFANKQNADSEFWLRYLAYSVESDEDKDKDEDYDLSDAPWMLRVALKDRELVKAVMNANMSTKKKGQEGEVGFRPPVYEERGTDKLAGHIVRKGPSAEAVFHLYKVYVHEAPSRGVKETFKNNVYRWVFRFLKACPNVLIGSHMVSKGANNGFGKVIDLVLGEDVDSSVAAYHDFDEKEPGKSTGKFRGHRAHVYACMLPEEGLKEMLSIFDGNFDLFGNPISGREENSRALLAGNFLDRNGKRVTYDVLTAVNSSKTLCNISTEGSVCGMADMFGCKDAGQLQREFPASFGLMERIHMCLIEVVAGLENITVAEAVEKFRIRGDFTYLHSKCMLLKHYMQVYHLDYPPAVLEAAREGGHHLFVAVFPLRECGMWLRLLPEVPFSGVDEDGVGVIDYQAETKNVFWAKSSGARNGTDTKNEQKKQGCRKIDGFWLYVPYGDCAMIPASVYHSGNLRTSATGNTRGHFYVIMENKAKPTLGDMVKGWDYKAIQTYLVGVRAPRAKKDVSEFLVPQMAVSMFGVESKKDQDFANIMNEEGQYLVEGEGSSGEDTEAGVSGKKANGSDAIREELQKFVTENVKAFSSCMQVTV